MSPRSTQILGSPIVGIGQHDQVLSDGRSIRHEVIPDAGAFEVKRN
jgi:hypothetical protein